MSWDWELRAEAVLWSTIVNSGYFLDDLQRGMGLGEKRTAMQTLPVRVADLWLIHTTLH